MSALVRRDRRCVGEKCCFRKHGQGGCPCYEGLVLAAQERAERERIERFGKLGKKDKGKIERGQQSLF